MEDKTTMMSASRNSQPPTPLQLLETAFRHRRLMIGCLAAMVLVPLIAALVLPNYRGEMKFLLVRERIDPVVTPSEEKDSLAVVNAPVVSEQELNSEVELLNSHELLRNVVLKCDLQHRGAGWRRWGQSEEQQIESAIRSLNSSLDVQPVRKTNVIQVMYKNRDPKLAAQVLNEISRLYLEKHRDVHRSPGQFEFFQQQTEQYRKGLQRTELELAEFPTKYGAVSPALVRDITLQKLNDFQASAEQTHAALAETKNRIRELETLGTTTAPRITTQLRSSDNPHLLQMMKSTLLTLELKRSELLAKFQPDYRPVQEVEKEIAETRAAIANEEKSPVREETTDLDPVKEWIRSELAKNRADLQGLQARAQATENTARAYQAKANQLERTSLAQSDLQRTAKAQENNYLLYLTKQEEARITDALDETRILNVTMAEQPIVPALPAHSPVAYAGLSFIAMILLTIGGVWTLHYLNSTVRTSSEVESLLQTRLLASVPYHQGTEEGEVSSNGHGNGNGNGNGHGNGNGNGNGHHQFTSPIPRVVKDWVNSRPF